MFCPLAVDYGNIADWIAGLGSLAAVIAALWIAGSQNRNAARLRAIEANEAHGRRAQVIAEAIRLAADVEAQAMGYAQLTSLGGDDAETRKHEVAADIAGLRSQREALQRFPGTDPRVFTEIGRAVHDCRVERGFATQSTSHAGLTMRRIAESMRARRDALAAL